MKKRIYKHKPLDFESSLTYIAILQMQLNILTCLENWMNSITRMYLAIKIFCFINRNSGLIPFVLALYLNDTRQLVPANGMKAISWR